VPDLQSMFKDAWSQALVGINAAEQEAERVLGRIADAAGFTPEDVRRHAREFGDRLQQQRRDVERGIDEAVKKATGRFKFPSQSEVDELRGRVEALSRQVEALAQERNRPPG